MGLFRKQKEKSKEVEQESKESLSPEELFVVKWLDKIKSYCPDADFATYQKKGQVQSRPITDQLWGFLNEAHVERENQSYKNISSGGLSKEEIKEWLESSRAVGFYHYGEFLESEYNLTKKPNKILNAIGYYRRAIEQDPTIPASHTRLRILYKRHAEELGIQDEYRAYLEDIVNNPARYDKHNNPAGIVDPSKKALDKLI